MEKEILEAKLAYTDLEDDREIRKEILQVLASGFSCLQEHGIEEREEVKTAKRREVTEWLEARGIQL